MSGGLTGTVRRFVAAALGLGMTCAGLAIPLTAVPAAAAPLTRAFLDSEYGEVFKNGQTTIATTVAIAPTSTNSRVEVTISTGPTFVLVFEAPTGALLVPGTTYAGAVKTAGPGQPGLDLSGGAPAHTCATVAGRFTVDELTWDGTAVQTFSARFEHHCDGADPAMFGAVSIGASAPFRTRFLPAFVTDMEWATTEQPKSKQLTITNSGPDSDVIASASITGPDAANFQLGGSCIGKTLTSNDTCQYIVTLAPTGPARDLTAELTIFDDMAPVGGSGRDIALKGRAGGSGSMFMDSEPNHYVGQGESLALDVEYLSGGANGIQLVLKEPGNINSYLLDIDPRTAQTLAVGTYNNAVSSPDATHPAISFAGDGRACSNDFGRFVIDELTFFPDGMPRTLALRFEHRCEATGPTVFGSVALNATGPAPGHQVAPSSVAFGNVTAGATSPPQQIVVSNAGAGSLTMANASITGPNASSFTMADDCSGQVLAPGGTCTFTVRFQPNGARGVRTAAVTFFDSLAPAGGSGRDVALSGNATALLNVPGNHATIQSAINASVDGDVVVVAAGTYHELINFNGKAIEVRSAQGPDATIIDGDFIGAVVTFFPGAPGSVLRGFTLQHGYDNGNSGAGVFIFGGSPVIVGNYIVDNYADSNGGGVQAVGTPTIVGNLIAGNASCSAAGINVAGAAIVQGNVIVDNVAQCSGGTGGGIHLINSNGAQVLGNLIQRNTATSGGGVSMNVAGSVSIAGNAFVENTADAGGGGINAFNDSRPAIVNNVFVRNQAGHGEAMSLSFPSGAVGANVLNNTFTQNGKIEITGGTTQTRVVNNVSTDVIDCGGGTFSPTFRNNNVASYTGNCTSTTGVNGNFSAPPLFLDPVEDDYRLQAISPSVNTGDNAAAALPAFDIDGRPRIEHGTVDQGAYEYYVIRERRTPPTQPASPSTPPVDRAPYRFGGTPHGSGTEMAAALRPQGSVLAVTLPPPAEGGAPSGQAKPPNRRPKGGGGGASW